MRTTAIAVCRPTSSWRSALIAARADRRAGWHWRRRPARLPRSTLHRPATGPDSERDRPPPAPAIVACTRQSMRTSLQRLRRRRIERQQCRQHPAAKQEAGGDADAGEQAAFRSVAGG